MTSSLRLGVVGTGYWADVTHAAAASAAPSWNLTAVWGRDAGRAAALAERHGAVHARTDFDAFLAEVDAVTFAVPPQLQSELALRAIHAGKHVALEKPIATSLQDAERLASAAEANGVATLVLFTMLFDERVRTLVKEVRAGRRWTGGAGLWLGSALNDENPFNTPWRHEKGGLWDLGPHAISVLWKTIGPIRSVRAEAGEGDLVHLIMTHDDGRTSTTSMTLRAPDAADGFSTLLWGAEGRQEVTVDDVDAVTAFVTAYEDLAGLIASGDRSHECDVRFGRDVVRVLADAETQLAGAV
jgi:predicted dehydrogenase